MGFSRFVVFSIWLGIVVSTDLSGVLQAPAFCYDPVGIFQIFGDNLPNHLSADFLRSFQILLCMLLAVLALGIRPFLPSALTGAVGLLCFESLLKGYSPFINHSRLGILYAAIATSLFPAADSFALFRFKKIQQSPDAVYKAGMAFIAFAFTLAYAFIGLRRLVLGPEVLWNDSLLYWITTRTLELPGHAFDFALGLDAIQSPFLVFSMKLGFGIVTLFEILSPCVIFSDRFRRIWLIVMVPFHFATWALMKIFFWENILLICVYLTGFSYCFVPKLAKLSNHTNQAIPRKSVE